MKRSAVGLLLLFAMNMQLLAVGAKESETVIEPEASPDGVLVLADVSDEPVKKIKRFQPLADYLADRLHEYGIDIGEVRIAPDMQGMANYLSAGKADLYFDSPFPAMRVCEMSGARPILRRWKGGVAEYHTVFFAREEQGFDDLKDLAGQHVAFEEPHSTSGYMLPLAHLVAKGLNPVETSTDATLSAGEIGYSFAGDDENVIQWVLEGRTVAGVLNIGTFQEIPEQTRSTLVILDRTESVARQVVVVRPGMDPKLVAAISSILQEMHQDPEGRDALEIHRTTQFDAFPEGAESAFDRMRELYASTQ